MEKNSNEKIILELSTLVRHVTSTTYKTGCYLDRSGYLLLQHIVTHGPTGVKALAEEFGLNVSTTSRQSAALAQKGYVKRVPDPVDGRAFSLQITALGEKALNHDRELRRTLIDEVFKDWTAQEREMFGELLAKFNRAF
ncbi:MarR family winged helix-turn-helix transcriptional regulator [Alicyclobacillus fastidiosus]|uniref:MarR family transcriptional regulator n=1 Tax=Alicyclobacillus fastidiosus TaxID=392011 RepID=A0ABV5AJM3_9BACL|nr:MarR family transcriptional regulator [Alicyclobacillus fastidiosus]WEH08239.1 MarR family transcriptional regulator [Alicyclobacillus fastidiosus]